MNTIYKPELKKLAGLLILSGTVFLLGLNSRLIESFYSEGFYQLSSPIQRFISGIFPFALGDFLYLLLILYCLKSLYVYSKKAIRKQLRQTDRFLIPLQLINFILILYLAFKLLWGLNYSRLPIAKQLNIGNEKYTNKELVALGDYMVDQINQIQTKRALNLPKQAYTVKELESNATEAYHILATKNSFFTYKIPSVKAVLNSWIITKIGLEGYYSPLSGEANVNMMLNSANLPFVTCHEIAHQLGVGREDEANLVGYLVSTASPDLNFQYSGNYCVLKNVLYEIGVKSPLDYERLRKKINAATLQDFKADREFWRKYNSDMFGYMEVTLDQFLKLNNQNKGVDSYQDIVLWLYNLHKKALK